MQTYFYRVDEIVKTFGKGDSQEEGFSHSLDFQCDSLAESRLQAYEYYQERVDVLSKEEDYFLPFAPVKDSYVGLLATYSLTLYFVACYNEDEYYLYGLEGASEDEAAKAREVEAEVFAIASNDSQQINEE